MLTVRKLVKVVRRRVAWGIVRDGDGDGPDPDPGPGGGAGVGVGAGIGVVSWFLIYLFF